MSEWGILSQTGSPRLAPDEETATGKAGDNAETRTQLARVEKKPSGPGHKPSTKDLAGGMFTWHAKVHMAAMGRMHLGGEAFETEPWSPCNEQGDDLDDRREPTTATRQRELSNHWGLREDRLSRSLWGKRCVQAHAETA